FFLFGSFPDPECLESRVSNFESRISVSKLVLRRICGCLLSSLKEISFLVKECREKLDSPPKIFDAIGEGRLNRLEGCFPEEILLPEASLPSGNCSSSWTDSFDSRRSDVVEITVEIQK